MITVLHFRRQLDRPPAAVAVMGIDVRKIKVPDDVTAWLALRRRAMAGQKPLVRSWTDDDFAREMSGKRWWNARHTWLALAGSLRDPETGERSSPDIGKTSSERNIVGAVTLAIREGEATTIPVVHWLLVDPEFRRRGIGRLLMSHLERAAWVAGWRQVQLETHSDWREAVAFYQSIGYAPVRDRSPR